MFDACEFDGPDPNEGKFTLGTCLFWTIPHWKEPCCMDWKPSQGTNSAHPVTADRFSR